MARPLLRSGLWLAALLASWAGAALLLFDTSPVAPALLLAGLLVLAGLGLARSGAGALARAVAGVGFLAGLAAALLAPLPARVALAATAAQLLVAGLASADLGGKRRWLLPAGGHALVALASALVLARGDVFAPTVGLSYASGFAILALHAHWAQRRAGDDPRGWEAPLLLSIVVAMASMTAVYAAHVGMGASFAHAHEAALLAAVPALALLCAPPPAPAWMRKRAGIALDLFAHGAAAMALLNVLFLAFTFVSNWSLRVIFAALFAWQLVVIGVEYRTVRHAERRRQRPLVPIVEPVPPEPVTVIVPAANEAAVLPESLEKNLAVRYPLRFILVPATKSSDDTVAVAREWARRHPGRVRVVEGDTGSKAEDLNNAWKHVTTRHVLMLDADETIDRDSLLRGLQVLRARPEVGVVQGRKVSRAPDDGPLARFVSAERRYSTWMDHVMHGEDLGSAHFGGSAALVRREVPPGVGGWTDQTMTEDIEFTLRCHLDDRWKIAYCPEMVVREADPQDFGQLLKQRTRWARGWAQCFALYFPKVVEARKRLGARRAFGLILLLLIAMSALWTTFVPATLVMRLSGISPLMPIYVALPLSLILLPSRLLAYGYAAFRDPVIPLKATPARAAELALHAYLWILLGWFVQLHALYLELSKSPRVWYVTAKRSRKNAMG